MMYNVIEKFVSIDGEGPSAGELATFIRFSGCNLCCLWCDTRYSWDGTAKSELMTADEICGYVNETGIFNLTMTGGEPLIQPDIDKLICKLLKIHRLTIRIETNGSIDIAPFKKLFSSERVHFVVDYKLPDSKMEAEMCESNLQVVEPHDTFKFVISSDRDLDRAVECLRVNKLIERCQVYFSPVTDLIEPKKIVARMIDENLNGIRLQLQLHKYIWPKDMRGV